MLKRVMGKASFATLQDVSGRIQLYITNDITGEETPRSFQALGHGRHRRRGGHAVQNQNRRTGRFSHHPPADQVAAPAAGQVPRHDRPGTKIPPALR